MNKTMETNEFKNVVFTPWVGKKYSEGYDNKKILVLGESHYCDIGLCGNCVINPIDCDKLKNNDITKNVIKKFLCYVKGCSDLFSNWMNTFERFTNVFIGKRCNNEVILDFWDRIIFYNYVQKVITKGPREKVAKQEFKQVCNDSEKAFFEILEKYKPEIIILWGKRLWDNLSDVAQNKIKECEYLVIYHPSTSQFNYKCSSEFEKIKKGVKK